MSFISDKITNRKKKNNNNKKSFADGLKLRSLDDNYFPYACLVDEDVMLTKNGEVFQIIEILLDDFKLNQEGGLRDKIRQAIAENTNDLKTAFWIQTIKRKKARSKTRHSSISHEFLKRVYAVSQEMEESLNNYTTSVYITIIRQGRNFKLKYIKDYISASLLGRQHNRLIEDHINEVKNITNSIVSMLSLYHPKVLGIRKISEEEEYSEMAELLYFLVNFEDKEIPVLPVDISRYVNDSAYFFENGIMAMRNKTTNQIKLGMSFSLKEVPRVNMSNVSDIVNNTRAELIITEYVSYVDQKVATAQFKEQKAFLQGREDKRFQDDVGLSFLNASKEAKFCQSSLSVFVLANNTQELQTFVADAINMFSKHGIVMAREDISLERNYYAMMPANFSATHRLTIHDANEVACFSYSYTPQESDASAFLNETILFNLGTLKSNPVPIGLDRVNTNVIVGGQQNSGKTTMANFLASSIMREFDADLFVIEFNCRSRAFIEASGGKWYRISTDRQHHTALFNAMDLNLFSETEDKENYLFELFSLFLGINNVVITPEITTELKKIIEGIKEFAKTNKKFALHDIRQLFKETSIEQDLLSWHSIGRYYHLFDNRDDVFDRNNIMAFHIDESVSKNSLILASVINHIFLNIIQRSKGVSKPTIVILEEPFLAFGNGFFKTKLNKMIEKMRKLGIYCIFKVADIEKESATIVDFAQLVESCGMQIHFANKFADDNYGRVFRLEKLEYMAVRTLAGYEGRNVFIKNQNGIFSCKFELDDFPKMYHLLSDKGEVEGEIFKIKEALQTDSCERWVPAYFGNFNSNDDAEAQRAVQKEIKAIQDIKRLLES